VEGVNILVVNAGSHSLQVELLDDDDRALVSRSVDAEPAGDEARATIQAVLDEKQEIGAVGHRIVHGGPSLTEHRVVDEEVLAALREAAGFAPLHVPPALAAMATLRAALPGIPHVAVLDTVFHASIPEVARTYPVPERWRTGFGVRRYGFHGLSYAWATKRAAELLERPVGDLSLVMTHLGGGGSVSAVLGGRSQWNSMGLTPLEGLMMVSRSGSVDPGMLLWLQTAKGLTAEEVSDALEHHSGLLALSGDRSGDTRELVEWAASGDEQAQLALDVYTLRIRQEVAAAAALLPRLDALVFTGEIGADQPEVREAVCAGLPVLGLAGGLSTAQEEDGVISADGVPVLLVHPEENRQIAAEVRVVLNQ
jgi:acetate kinase